MILVEMRVLPFIYSYVPVCMFCAVRCVIVICCYLKISNYLAKCFLVFFLCLFLFCIFLFCVFCGFCIVFLPFCVLFLLLCCLFPIFVQVYRPLPPVGNTIAVNNIISYNIIQNFLLFFTFLKHTS